MGSSRTFEKALRGMRRLGVNVRSNKFRCPSSLGLVILLFPPLDELAVEGLEMVVNVLFLEGRVSEGTTLQTDKVEKRSQREGEFTSVTDDCSWVGWQELLGESNLAHGSKCLGRAHFLVCAVSDDLTHGRCTASDVFHRVCWTLYGIKLGTLHSHRSWLQVHG